MSKINGIYAASVSILDKELNLDIDKTIKHAENLIIQGCHGVVIFGSTGQAQLISSSEKIKLVEELSKSKFNNKFIIGTGFNSLKESLFFLKACKNFNFKNFLIMPPAYYNYEDKDVINFYSEIIKQHPWSQIILYNFEKLCGYKFSIACVEELVKKYPDQIIGVKDSSYNLYKDLKLKNFSILPGSESKLVSGLELGCSGVITATCNITAELSRNIFDDFINKKKQFQIEKLCNVREAFDKFNLISGIHTFLSSSHNSYINLLPPLSLLSKNNEKKLLDELTKLDFNYNFLKID